MSRLTRGLSEPRRLASDLTQIDSEAWKAASGLTPRVSRLTKTASRLTRGVSGLMKKLSGLTKFGSRLTIGVSELMKKLSRLTKSVSPVIRRDSRVKFCRRLKNFACFRRRAVLC